MGADNLPLVVELSAVPDVSCALAAVAGWPGVVLFDSALRHESLGRYSFLTADPFHFELVHDVDPQAPSPLENLRERLARFPTPTVPGLPPFQGGVAGMLSYDLGRAWEKIPAPRQDEFQLPVLAAGIYDWALAWDHALDRAWLVSHGYPEVSSQARSDRAAQRLAQVRARLDRSPPGTRPLQRSAIRKPQFTITPAWPVTDCPGLVSNFSRAEYLQTVARAIEYIRAGDIFQVNLSQRLLYPLSESPLELYRRLRSRNPAPFAGYFAHDDWVIASASPERFVRVAENEVETRPIKGTRRRRPRPEADLYTRDELRESEKDHAENVMIVDLLRNDLSRICQPGTVRVPALCQVESYETVQHLVSVVRGTLRPGATVWELLPAVFPGGSITGAPKVRAMQIISELEPTARGTYCGSLFYVGFDGQADSNILIRSFTIRHGWIQCPVGGGVVAQSSPADEYAETMHKAEGMLRALQPL